MAYTTVQDEGTSQTPRSILNFTGDSVVATDNSGSARTDVTVSAVRLQATSPGTAQTGNFNIETGIGRLAVQDKGGQVFNVKAYGAKGDGTTDDTTAISSAITAAAAVVPRGQVYFPHGTYKTTGDFDLSGKDGLTIRGAGIGSTKIELAHATNDLFKFGTGATPTHLLDITIGNFSITSETVTRTGGWVLRGYAAATASAGQLRRSRIEQLDIKKQVNGIWLNRYEYVWLTDLMMTNFKAAASGNNYGARFGQAASANQGSEILMHGVHISGVDLVQIPGDPLALDYGFFAEDCDAIHWEHSGAGDCLENALKMIAGSAGCHNHFFDHFAVDHTKNSHGAWITGTGVVETIEFTGCWFASAGRLSGGSASASGLRIDVTGSLVGDGRIVGCHFALNNGSALYADVNRLPWSVVANTFLQNGLGAVSNNDHSIFLDLTLNETGPNLIGNVSRGANGADIRTSSTTNRLRVMGNDWTKSPVTPPTVFGVEPDVYVGNSDQGGRCAASVYHSAAQTTTSGVELTLAFNQDSYNPRGQAVHDLTTNNSRLKVPASGSGAAGGPKSISGLYTISAGVEFASNTSGLRQVKILKNGATVLAYDNRTPVPSGVPTRVSLTHQALLVEGDYVEVVVYQNSGGNLAVSLGADRTWFSISKTL